MRKSSTPVPVALTRLPSGTAVIVTEDDGTRTHTLTRSTPWQLGHGEWVVLLADRTGGYALYRVRPASDCENTTNENP